MNNGDPLLWQLLLLFILISINPFFTCAEIALISINKNKLEKMSSLGPKTKGSRQAKRILFLTRQPAKFIATVQVVITLAGFLSSAIAASSFTQRLARWFASFGTPIPINTLSTISLISITIILSYFTLVLGELLPKRIALKKADTLAFAISGIVMFASRVFAPAVWLLTKSTNGLLRLIGINPEADAHAVTEEDIRLMIDIGSAGGVIKKIEKDILHKVFEFDNKTAGEVMTHRRDVIFFSLDDDEHEWERIISENQHNNYPVCDKSPDNIKGILKTRNYFLLKEKTREALLNILEPAYFVPLSVRTSKLFWQMKKSRNHFAVTVDEYGSMMGIITMKDLLEELVGNLDDDSSQPLEKPLIEIVDAEDPGKGWYINGAAPLELVARELDCTLPLAQYDTFAGFVFSLLGHIPGDGYRKKSEREEIEYVEEDGEEQRPGSRLSIEILEVKERRLEKALVKKISF